MTAPLSYAAAMMIDRRKRKVDASALKVGDKLVVEMTGHSFDGCTVEVVSTDVPAAPNGLARVVVDIVGNLPAGRDNRHTFTVACLLKPHA